MRVICEESYLAMNGASRQDIGDCALHKNLKPGRHKDQLIKRQAEYDHKIIIRRAELREEYRQKVESGEIRPPTHKERLIVTANGHPDRQDTQAARRILKRKGIPWL